MERRWLSVNEAAKELGLSTVTVYTAIQKGDLPYVRIGKTIRIDFDAVEKSIIGPPAEGVGSPDAA
jgi:excisionase family DNA binding protein